jgi:membrane-bound lytic murein transglycosylase D
LNKSILSLLCLGAFFLFQGTDNGVVPQEDQSAADFIRPLRTRKVIRSDHPAYREVIPPSYTGAKDRGDTLTLLNSQDLSRPNGFDQELTKYYINRYSSPSGLEWLKASMERAGPYLSFIRQEIAERNLPPELIYLPVIESEYVATAVSRSGAAGLWQFMRNSIAPFDMVVNDWVDERRDFWKSTQGALRKLDENYRLFGDWPLALAAYNAGAGALTRVTQNSGIKDYWLLSERRLLPTETIHYVPRFLAIVHIFSNPRQYGLVLWPENPDWTRVAVNRTVDLNLLAKEAGIHADELKRANRELLHNITPPGINYFLKVRTQDAEKVALALTGALPLINYHLYTIRSGDTLSVLALRYGVTVDQITSLNPGIQARYLRIGETLMIPAFRDVPALPANSEKDVVFSGSHLVKSGENLWSIARAYGISPETLAEANNMKVNDILREGRVLKTPIR